jgi:hypothetical protein
MPQTEPFHDPRHDQCSLQNTAQLTRAAPAHATPAPAALEHAPAPAAAEARHPPPAAGRCCRPSAATRLPAIKLSKLTAPCARPGECTSPKWLAHRPTGPVPAASTLSAPLAAQLAAAAAPRLSRSPDVLPPPLPCAAHAASGTAAASLCVVAAAAAAGCEAATS